MNQRERFRIGLMGTGSIAQVVHLPVLSQLPGVTVSHVCDKDRSKAAAIAQRFGITGVCDADHELFEAPDVDGIVICTPSHLHEAHVTAALESGKHVLVEKPLAFEPEAVDRLLAVAERAGRMLMVAMNNRYRPDVDALRPFVRGGELGDVFLVKAGWLHRKVRTVRPTWRHRRETAGGGALMDLGVQVLDLCLWMLGYPKVERVSANLHPGDGMDVEDTAAVLVVLEGGIAVGMEVSWNLMAERDQQYLWMLGTQGTISLSPFAAFKELEHGVVNVTPQVLRGSENPYNVSYRRQLSHFVEAAQGRLDASPPSEQRELMRLIQLAYKAAGEQKAVHA